MTEMGGGASCHMEGMLSGAGDRSGAMRGPHVGSRSPTARQSALGMTVHLPPGARRLLRAALAAMAVAAAAVGARQAQDLRAVVGVRAVENECALHTVAHLARDSPDAPERLSEFLQILTHRAIAICHIHYVQGAVDV